MRGNQIKNGKKKRTWLTGVLDGGGDELGGQDLGNLPETSLLANEALGDELEQGVGQGTTDQETCGERRNEKRRIRRQV